MRFITQSLDLPFAHRRRLWSFYQIATKVGATYLVTFPPSVERSLDAFSWVNLELDGIGLPLACVGLGSYQTKLVFLMLSPFGVLLITKVVSWFWREREHERKVARPTNGIRVQLKVAQVAFTQSTYKFLPIALRVSFLAFPTVSSVVSGEALETPRLFLPLTPPRLHRLHRRSRPFAVWTSMPTMDCPGQP